MRRREFRTPAPHRWSTLPSTLMAGLTAPEAAVQLLTLDSFLFGLERLRTLEALEADIID